MNIFFDKGSEAAEYAVKTGNFGAARIRRDSDLSDMHTHKSCELSVFLQGGGSLLIEDKRYEPDSGDLFVINRSHAHRLISGKGCTVEGYTLQLHPEFILSASTENTDLSACFSASGERVPNRVHLNEAELAEAVRLFSELEKGHGYGDDIIKREAAVRLLMLAGGVFAERNREDMSVSMCLPLKRAILYINNHFCEGIMLEDVARASFISVNQLCKLFKAALGTTVMKYIIGKRITRAKKLLKAGESVSDTAILCGFRDYSNFIRTFTASVGISPGKYSRMNNE